MINKSRSGTEKKCVFIMLELDLTQTSAVIAVDKIK